MVRELRCPNFVRTPCLHLRRGDVAMFVSGSRLRIKREVHQAAAQIKVKGARLISLTDSNDRELVDRSEIAILVPPLSEVGGSMLALALLELLASQVRGISRRTMRKARRESRRREKAQLARDRMVWMSIMVIDRDCLSKSQSCDLCRDYINCA